MLCPPSPPPNNNCLAAPGVSKTHCSDVVKRQRLISHECKARFHSSIESGQLYILSRPATRGAGERFHGFCPPCSRSKRCRPCPCLKAARVPVSLSRLARCHAASPMSLCPCPAWLAAVLLLLCPRVPVLLGSLPRRFSPCQCHRGSARADCSHLLGPVLPIGWVIVILPERCCPSACRKTAFSRSDTCQLPVTVWRDAGSRESSSREGGGAGRCPGMRSPMASVALWVLRPCPRRAVCARHPLSPSARVKRGFLYSMGGFWFWGTSQSGEHSHLPAGVVSPHAHGCPSTGTPCPCLQNGLRNSRFQLCNSLETKFMLFRISMEIFHHCLFWECTKMGLRVPLFSCRAVPAGRRGRYPHG